MAQTWRVEVLNDGVLNLLRDMELMRLIKLSSDRPTQERSGKDLIAKYKGSLAAQPLAETDQQLKELRAYIDEGLKSGVSERSVTDILNAKEVELNTRTDSSMADSAAGRLTSSTELKAEMKRW
jgi:hypothetical protein